MSTSREVSHEEAKQIALRLIAGSFRRDGERLDLDKRPKFSIPTRVNDDDDCLLIAYIEQNARLAATPKAGVDREAWEIDATRKDIVRAIEAWRANQLTTYTPSNILFDFGDEIIAALALPSVLGGVDQPSFADGRQCNEQSGKQLSPAWQPIETAPRDGQMILACSTNHSRVSVVGWSQHWEDEPHWDDVGSRNAMPSLYMNANFFTHWMPLPSVLPQTNALPPGNAGLVSGGGR